MVVDLVSCRVDALPDCNIKENHEVENPMTLVRSFTLPFHPDQSIRLNGKSQKNRVSILLGVNGTQKSSVLRGLLEDGLDRAQDDKRPSGLPTCTTRWTNDLPARVVAVSSAATDRFPARTNFGETRLLTRYDIAQYAYVGPRTGRNIVSRTQSVHALLAEVLQLDTVPASVSAFISALSEKTTVPYKLRVQLGRRPPTGPNRPNDSPPTLDKFLSNTSSPLGFSKNPRFVDQIDRLLRDSALFHEAEHLYRFIRETPRGRMQVDLDLSAAEPLAGALFSPRAIHFGLSAGFLRLENLSLVGDRREAQNPDAYSAGQWGLFSSLATAALAARDRSLFLVDEPENALHPGWQREYIADFLKGISHCKGCHLFLATHSPLLVSSLGAQDADLIGLRLIDDRAVEVRLMDVPVGWQATDVLEDVFGLPSTRAAAIVEEIESAMALIADGASKNAKALEKIAKRLVPLLETLPEDDVARQVIASICRISGVKP